MYLMLVKYSRVANQTATKNLHTTNCFIRTYTIDFQNNMLGEIFIHQQTISPSLSTSLHNCTNIVLLKTPYYYISTRGRAAKRSGPKTDGPYRWAKQKKKNP